MLSLVDRISDLPAHAYRNKVIFPLLPDTNLTLIILSYGFYLDKAKILLRRLSRVGFNMGTCADEWSAHFDRFVRKRVEIPISSNQTFILCHSEYERFYSVREMMPSLAPDHAQSDVAGMRTICPINNLSQIKTLRVLHHPYLFNQFNKSGEQQ